MEIIIIIIIIITIIISIATYMRYIKLFQVESSQLDTTWKTQTLQAFQFSNFCSIRFEDQAMNH
jgi:predicted Holliday junction resolvase-like endonuclease